MLLSIAPYWNWNRVKREYSSIILNSQSHHIGIETTEEQLDGELIATLNRTILELKHRFYIQIPFHISLSIAPYWNWNGAPHLIVASQIFLSIAPYWNWNILLSCCYAFVAYSQSHHIGIETQTTAGKWLKTVPLNRTILELKLLTNHRQQPPQRSSQSHHIGIETCVLAGYSGAN